MKTWNKALAVILSLALALSLTACGGTPQSSAPAPESSEASSKPAESTPPSKAEESVPEEPESTPEEKPASADETPREETLYMGTGQWGTVINANPFSTNANNSLFCGNDSGNPPELHYETLYMYNLLTGGADPLLADGPWEFDGDNNLTVKLKPAAKWSDGTPVTAKDVAATFDAHIRTQSNAGVVYGSYIASVEAVDDHTVVFHPTENVNLPLMQAYVVQDYVMQAAYLEKKFQEYGEAYDDFKNDTMYDAPYSGPYDCSINNAQKSGGMRNDDYWGQDASMWGKLPVPKYIVHNIYADNNAYLSAMKAGEMDMGQMYVANINVTWEEDGYPISTYLDKAPNHISVVKPTAIFNTTVPGLDQPAVRKAIAMAVDFDQVNSSAMTGQSPSFEEYPRMLFSPQDEIREKWVKDEAALQELGWKGNDPDAANKLLDEAGIVDTDGDGIREYPAGNNLTFQASCPVGWSDWEASMGIVADAGKKIGISIETYFPEAAQWTEDIQTGNFTITMNSFGGGVSSPWSTFNDMFFNYGGEYPATITKCYSRFNSERANELLALSAKEQDEEKLKDYYQELNEIYLTEVPCFALMYRPMLFHEASETVWTGFPSEGDGISPMNCIMGQGVAALYNLELINR